MSVPGIHEYTQREVYTSSRQAALNNKRPIIGKVSSFFHRRSVASTESAMHYSTFNDSFDNGDIKSRKFDAMLFNNQDADASENVDVAFEQLMVSIILSHRIPKTQNFDPTYAWTLLCCRKSMAYHLISNQTWKH
jgi:hypothetical protein